MMNFNGTPKTLQICLENASREMEITHGSKLTEAEIEIIKTHVIDFFRNVISPVYYDADEETQDLIDIALERIAPKKSLELEEEDEHAQGIPA